MGSNLPDWNYEEELRKTADAFTKARVAVYPAEAGGLKPDSLFDAGALPKSMTNAHQATDAAITELQNDSKQRNANQATMEELAHETGGEAH